MTTSVPSLIIPPPFGLEKPCEIIRSLRSSAAHEATSITCTLLPPSIVMPGEGGPLIVSRLSVICGNVLASVIVPVTLNRIVSLPVPAVQPFVAVLVFAAVIASRKAQIPFAPGSASELTTIVAAPAAVLSVSARTTAIAIVFLVAIGCLLPSSVDRNADHIRPETLTVTSLKNTELRWRDLDLRRVGELKR